MTFEEFQKKKREGTLIQNKSSMSFEEFKQRKTDGTLLNKQEPKTELAKVEMTKSVEPVIDMSKYTPEEQKMLSSGQYKVNPTYDPNNKYSPKLIYSGELKTSENLNGNAKGLDKAKIVAGKVGNTVKDIVASAGIGAISAAEGLANTGIAAVGNIANLVGAKDAGNYLTNMVKDDITGELQQKLDTSTKSGYGRYTPSILGMDVRNISQEGARMLTAGVGGLPGFIGSAIGGNTQEALKEDQSLGRASIYGGITGTIEGATEKLFDTFKLLGGGALDKFIPKNVVARLATAPLGEYVEEWISQGANPFVKMATYDADIKNPVGSWDNFKEWLANNHEAGWQGFVMGLVLQGGSDTSNAEARQQYKNEVTKAVDKIKGLTQQQKQEAVNKLVKEAENSKVQVEEVKRLALPPANENRIYENNGNIVLPETINANNMNREIDYSPVNARQVLKSVETQENVVRELPTMASQQAILPTNQIESKIAQKGNIEQIREEAKNAPKNIIKDAKSDGKVTESVSKLRSFYQTAQEGTAVDQEYVKDIKKSKKAFEYVPISNQETLNEAKNEIKQDLEKSERDFLSGESSGLTAKDTAIAEMLIVEAQKNGDYEKANYLSAALAEKLTQAGQAIQATKIFKRMTPEGMILYAQRQINKANKDLKTGNPKLYDKLKKEGALPKLDDADIKKITEYMQEAQNAPDDYWNSRKKDVAVAKALSVAGNKIPSDMLDKVASIRRNGLLLNIKTLNRNVGSNAAFGTLEMIKDIPAAGIDKLTSLITKQRTTTLPNLKAYGKGIKKGAIEGVEDIRENISTTGKGSKYELPSKTFKRTDSYKDIIDAFKSGKTKEATKKAFRRALSDYEDAAMYIVEGTDRPFWQGRFESELANQMKLKGLEYGVDAPTNEILDAAKNSADYATFKNKNKLSETFGQIKKALNGGKPIGAADVLGLTFTNVPGSVGTKVYDYSPAGVITSAKELYNAISNNGKFDQRKFVDSLSRALIGSGGWALGSYLIGQGIIRGTADDDDDKANAEKQMGLQENSLNISALERLINGEDTTLQKGDKFYSFDWLQPVSAPILIGSDIYNAKKEGESGVYAGMKSAINQVSDMSSLSQVSKLFKGYSGSDIAENALKVIGEFPSSFIPTLWNNAGQFTDEYKRVTYDNSDLFYQTNVNKILSKIPGLRETLEKQIDTFGNEQKQYNNGNDFWSTFVNPGYNSTYDPTPLQEEILRLYNETGDKGVFPITAGGSLTYKNENLKLNPKQKMTYQKTSGKYISEILPVVIQSEAYKNFDDTQKVELLKEAIADSNILGKASVDVKTGAYDDYMKKVNKLKGINLADYYLAYTAQKGIESDKDINGKTIENSKSIKVKNAIDNATPNLSESQRSILYDIFNVSKTVQEGKATSVLLPTMANQIKKLPTLEK